MVAHSFMQQRKGAAGSFQPCGVSYPCLWPLLCSVPPWVVQSLFCRLALGARVAQEHKKSCGDHVDEWDGVAVKRKMRQEPSLAQCVRPGRSVCVYMGKIAFSVVLWQIFWLLHRKKPGIHNYVRAWKSTYSLTHGFPCPSLQQRCQARSSYRTVLVFFFLVRNQDWQSKIWANLLLLLCREENTSCSYNNLEKMFSGESSVTFLPVGIVEKRALS